MSKKGSLVPNSLSRVVCGEKISDETAVLCKKRKALASLPNGTVQSEAKKTKLPKDKENLSCSDSVETCEVKDFEAFVTKEVAVKSFENNRKLRNEAYYRYATEVKRCRGKGNQYKVCECCKKWIRTRYPDK